MRDVRRRLRLLAALLAILLAGADVAMAQVATTTVQDTIYCANGTPASGSVLVSWNAFTTAGGVAVPAGSTSATIGAGGVLTIALVPNADATPMGSYYTAVLHLNDGTTSREYWIVPAVVPGGGPAKLAAIQNQVLPTSVAMQTVSKQYVDTAIARAGGGGSGTMAAQNANAVAITGGTIDGTVMGGTTPAAGSFTTLSATTPLSVASGGTGATTAYAARTNLGLGAATYWASPGGNGVTQQVNVANVALCTPFYVQAAGGLSVGHISFAVEAADGANNSDVSINNGTTGALIADIGAQHLASTGTVNAAFVQGTVTIPAGKNFLCETSAGSTMALYFYNQVPVSYQIASGSLGTTSGGAMGTITVPNDSTAGVSGVGPWILLYP